MFENEAVDFPEESPIHAVADLVRLTRDKLKSAEVNLIVASGHESSALLERNLTGTGRGSILVLYDPAQHAVVRGMEIECPPSTSLAAWIVSTTKLLSLYRKHRRRVVFASLAAAQADPEHFWSELIRHFKITKDTVQDVELPPCAPVATAWHTVLAYKAVSADAEAQALELELEAAALPLRLKNVDIDSVFAEISEMMKVAGPPRPADAERGQLMDQVCEMEAVLIAQQRTISEQRDSVAKLRDEAKAAGRLVTSLQARLVDEEIQRASAKAWPDQGASMGFLNIPAHIGEAIHALLHNAAWSALPAFLRRSWQMRVLKASGLVEPAWYLDYHRDVAEANIDPLKHYMEYGAKEGRVFNSSLAEKHARMLIESGLFDPAWYLGHHKDVADAKIDPIRHYIEHGAKEGRAPNANYR